jgi:hypothetical protein
MKTRNTVINVGSLGMLNLNQTMVRKGSLPWLGKCYAISRLYHALNVCTCKDQPNKCHGTSMNIDTILIS